MVRAITVTARTINTILMTSIKYHLNLFSLDLLGLYKVGGSAVPEVITKVNTATLLFCQKELFCSNLYLVKRARLKNLEEGNMMFV